MKINKSIGFFLYLCATASCLAQGGERAQVIVTGYTRSISASATGPTTTLRDRRVAEGPGFWEDEIDVSDSSFFRTSQARAKQAGYIDTALLSCSAESLSSFVLPLSNFRSKAKSYYEVAFEVSGGPTLVDVLWGLTLRADPTTPIIGSCRWALETDGERIGRHRNTVGSDQDIVETVLLGDGSYQFIVEASTIMPTLVDVGTESIFARSGAVLFWHNADVFIW